MDRPMMELAAERGSVNFPTPRFSDLRMDGWLISPDVTRAGRLDVVPWTQERIDNYYLRVERWEKYGTRIVRAARMCGRGIVGGVVGWGMQRLEIPRVPPNDRTRFITRCTFRGVRDTGGSEDE